MTPEATAPLDRECLAIDSGSADWLMERDARNLETVAGGAAARIEVYRFADPSVTAGRHALVRDEDFRRWSLAGHAFARRPTGGGILRHSADDIAFGAAFPCGAGFAGDYLRLVSEAIADALAGQGVETSVPDAKGDQPVCCFQRALGWELLRNGEKLVGLAARRVRGGVLVQGVLSVRRDPALDAALIGVGPRVDLSDVAFDAEAWASRFRGLLAKVRIGS